MDAERARVLATEFKDRLQAEGLRGVVAFADAEHGGLAIVLNAQDSPLVIRQADYAIVVPDELAEKLAAGDALAQAVQAKQLQEAIAALLLLENHLLNATNRVRTVCATLRRAGVQPQMRNGGGQRAEGRGDGLAGGGGRTG